MIRPTPEQRAVLSRSEQRAFAIADRVNRDPRLKAGSERFLRQVGLRWVRACTKNLLHTEGEDALSGLQPDRGVMLVSNHRSFFDLFVISAIVLQRAPWAKRLYFPVRSTFFYERPLGTLVNAAMSGFAMYPPILRDRSKSAFNGFAVDLLAELGAQPGTVIGYHPEGTRGKGPDPYALLPPGVGTGAIARKAQPLVLPVFTLGLTNDLVSQVRSNFNGTGAPVTVVFGAPLDLREFYDAPDRLRTHRAIAVAINGALGELGERERVVRRDRGLPPASG